MHQSLYRAHRPTRFADVAGQDHVIDALSEQLRAGTPAHAYLFAGSRGLGKTTVARIFAKELGTTERDLYEIDAASHNGVDNIRELAENIYTLPFESKYKVFILDEAHMLSKGAWNAFLKTLEEPPAHAIFILATTELAKVPDTVQSRCQVFEFKKPTRQGLSKVVESVAKAEGYTLGAGVGNLIAILADGSYRDALSILEKTFASSKDKKLSLEEAEKAAGAPKRSLVETLVSALGKGESEGALVAIRKASDAGVDMHLYLALALELMRNVLLVRHAPELRKEIAEETGEEYAVVERLAKEGDKLTHATLLAFLEASGRIRYASVPALPLELAVLSLTGQD